MTEVAARAVLAEAIGCSPADLPAGADIVSTPGWDSIAHMRLVLAIEARRGERLDPAAILEATSLEAIARLLAPVEAG